MMLRQGLVAILLCLAPAVATAQTPAAAQIPVTPQNQTASLRDQLMPSADALKLQTHAVVQESAEAKVNAPQAYSGSGTGFMIAGAALFVAGLLVEGDAGTILVLAGAGIGAYGLYLHFR